jgi:flagellar basal-body rod protein FlgC
MDLFHSMSISASGLNAQRTVINVIAENLANAHTTRTEEGGPYLKKEAVLSTAPISSNFADLLSYQMGQEPIGVKVVDVVEDPNGLQVIYEPSHPDADETGTVLLPNVNIMEEMVSLLNASRSYEANVTAFNASKGMALKALEIGSK